MSFSYDKSEIYCYHCYIIHVNVLDVYRKIDSNDFDDLLHDVGFTPTPTKKEIPKALSELQKQAKLAKMDPEKAKVSSENRFISGFRRVLNIAVDKEQLIEK